MKKSILAVIFIIALFLVSCNKQEYSINFNHEELSLTIGEEIDLGYISNIEDQDEIKISFSEPSIIDYDGSKYLAINPGQLEVTIYWEKDKEINDTLLVYINDLERNISFKESSITINDETVEFGLELKNLSLDDLGYRLTNQDIVFVTHDWKIEGKNEGTTILTVFYLNNDEIYAELEITVEIDKSISFTVDSLTIDNDPNTPWEVALPIEIINIDSNDIYFIFDIAGIVRIENNTIIPIKFGTVNITAIYIKDTSISATLIVEIKELIPVYTKNDYQYWLETLSSKYDPYNIIYTRAEINDYNSKTLSDYSNTKVMNILDQPKTITKLGLQNLINNYSNISRYTVYDNGTRISEEQKNSVLLNRNLNNIPATVNLRYGIVTDFAALRSYPTNYYSETNSLDRFQETALNVGEGVIIYHTSLDGNWYFVQAENYNGWVESKNIGVSSFETVEEFLTNENFIIITADRIRINNADVRMGQRIPFTNKTNENYTLLFPTRDSIGNLELKDILISNTEDINEGYLDYTIENIFKQGFKLLGINYSWGDKYLDGRDCSSTLNGIYKTFGLMMPRNTSNQSKIPGYSENLSGNISIDKIRDYQPGTLLFSSGHVLMYIGEDADGVTHVLHNTNAYVAGCKVQTLQSYGITKIIAITTFYN